MKKRNAAFLGILLAFAPCFIASAQLAGGDFKTDKPIEISADQLEVVQQNRKAVFRGNVVAVQDKMTIRAEIMTVYYRTTKERSATMGAISKIEVQNNVTLSTPQESAKAQYGVYQVDSKKIQLAGNVILNRGQNELRGDRLDFDLKTQKSLLTSAGSKNGVSSETGGRVKGVFLPTQ
jgi:lipopolysaccharide export system protein LptA